MRSFLDRRLSTLAWLALAAGLLPLASGLHWSLDLASHFTAHLAAVALAVAVLSTFRRRGGAALVALAAVSVCVLRLWPANVSLPAPRPDGPHEGDLVVLQWNVHKGNANIAGIFDWAETLESRPHVVALLETSSQTSAALAGWLGRQASAPGRPGAARPYRIAAEVTGYGAFDLTVLTRLERLSATTITHPVSGLRSILIAPCGILASGGGPASRVSGSQTRTRSGSGALETGHQPALLFTHPPPPLDARMSARRNAQLENIARLVATRHGQVAVLGDLNITPWSSTFASLLRASGLVEVRGAWLPAATWAPAFVPLALGLPIDHTLVPPGWRVLERLRGPRLGSDHAPLVTALRPDSPCTAVTLDLARRHETVVHPRENAY